jgi:DNA (cytosine-5)-methyltransferase 1
MKILNLYCGIGGNRKLWGEDHDITAVELEPEIAEIYQGYFPNDNVIVADAHQYLLDHYSEFDFIWSSPPCPTHSEMRRCGTYKGQQPAVYPEMDLYQQIILLQYYAKKHTKYVVENVNPYYEPLIYPSKKLHRHFYWSNFPIGNFQVTNERKHLDIKVNSTVYGFNIYDTKAKNKVKILRNMVDPELGEHILNCALNIITKSNTKQQTLF